MKRIVMAYSVGLLTSTFILGIVYWVENGSSQATESTTVTENEIQTYIEEQQLKLLPEDEYIELMNENQELTNRLNGLDQGNEPNESVEEETSSDGSEVFNYVLEIESGMNSSDIADLLEKNKIIDEAQSFIDYLADHELSQTIQLGSYEVDSSMSIEEIAQLITR